MRKEYEDTFSVFRPSDDSVNRALDIPQSANRRHRGHLFIPAVAVVACLAVVVTAAIGTSSADDAAPVVTDTVSSSSIVIPGEVYVAYAGEKPSYIFGADHSVSTPMKSKVGVVDIRGKSKDEIDCIVSDIYDRYDLTTWHFPYYERDGENVLTLINKGDNAYKNALVYQFRNGFFDVKLDDDQVADVREIRVKNTSPDAVVTITDLGLYYDDDYNLRDDYAMYAKGAYFTNSCSNHYYYDQDLYGTVCKTDDTPTDSNPFVSISGDKYRRAVAIAKKQGNRVFGISWDIYDGLIYKLNSDPDFDLSTISDTLTFEVEFNNGSVARSVVAVTLDKDGYMYAKSISFDCVS